MSNCKHGNPLLGSSATCDCENRQIYAQSATISTQKAQLSVLADYIIKDANRHTTFQDEEEILEFIRSIKAAQ